MSAKKSGKRYILLLFMLLIPLAMLVGFSIWIVTENVEIKPELGIENVIIKYLDNNETIYDGNIQLPSNTYLGLDDELTYYYKGSSDDDYIAVDLEQLNGPINVGDYLIKVLYYEEVIDSNNNSITVEKEIKNLTFKIKPATIDMSGISFNDETKVYNGNSQSIEITGTLPKEIKEVKYTGGGTNVGTYQVTATFVYDTLNYEVVESKTAFLTIEEKDISELTYSFTTNPLGIFNYTGSDIDEIINGFTIEYEGKTLTKGTDYNINFDNIKSIGNYTVIATAIPGGNYTGSLNVQYSIISSSLNINFDTTKTFEYTGSEVDLTDCITVKNTQGETIVPESISYKYKQQNADEYLEGLPIDSTAYKILITVEHSSYSTVEKEIEIIINKADISKSSIELIVDNFDYNGNAQNAQISSVTFNEKNLILGDDYISPVCSNNTNAGTATITITGTGNFKGTATKEYTINKIDPTITFPTITSFAEGGTPTITTAGTVTGIGGKTVAGQLIMDSTSSIVFPDGSEASTTVEISYSFMSTDNNYNNVSRKKTTATMLAVAYIGTNYYGTIKRAVEAANVGSSKNVYIIHNLGVAIPVKESITIDSGVKVYATYDGTKYEVGENGIEAINGSSYADVNANSVANNRKTLINLTNGADIIISNGAAFYLGGQTRTLGVTGLYTEINLDTGSGIHVAGEFHCFGYVKENASSAKNGNQEEYKNDATCYNNSFDGGNLVLDGNVDANGRLINVVSTGKVVTTIGFYDFNSAALTLMSYNDAGVFPLNIFDFNNLQTYIQFESGAVFTVRTYLIATTSVANKAVYQEIDVINDSNSMFNLLDGKCGFEYCPADVLYTSKTGLTRIFIDGSMNQGSVTLSIDPGIGSVQTITTKDKFIPISYKLNIYVNENGSFDTNGYDVKMLPGSFMQINPGGSLTVNSDMIFYEGIHKNKLYNYTNDLDAVLINNGEIILTSQGKLAANILTTALDDSAVLDFSLVNNANAFTVTSPDGETAIAINRTSIGLFVDETEEGKSLYQFMPNTVVYSDPNGNQCWNGEKNTIRHINISVVDMGYTKDIYAYEIYIADDSSGTNSTPATSGAETTEKSIEIPLNKYILIKVTRAAGATFEDGTAVSSSTWYLIEDDIELIITPNEGILLTVQTYANSGNGQTGFRVFECPTSNGTFYEVAYLYSISKETVYMVKGYYFKIEITAGTGTTVLDSSNYYYGLTSEYKPNSTGDFKTGKKGTFKEKTAYLLDNEYTVYFHRKSLTECIAAGTMITLWDGSKKPIEEITLDDLLLVFNHETGTYEFANIIFIDDDGWKTYRVINLVFSNGQTIKVIYEHGFFDLELNEYVYIREDNYQDYIGHRFYTGELINGVYLGGETTLEDVYITEEYTGCYSPVTVYHLNYYTDGLLSMPGGISGLFNIFEMNDDLRYDLEQMKEDIEKYGLYTYEDFKDYIPYEVYAAFPAEYFKVSVGKDNITWEQILSLIDRYLNLMI